MSDTRSSASSSATDGETLVEPPAAAVAREVHPARAAWAELAGLPDVILPGTLLGRYVVLEVVGRGAMGTVVRAYNPRLRREVAVKRLRPRATAVEQAETRLVREARAMAQLNHPNVVAVYDVEAESGLVLVAMEYVRGPTLREWLRTPRTPREVLDAFRQAAAGLVAAHAAGLVHRDFKPANVLVEEPHGSQRLGRVRVTDFGLARGVPTEEPVALESSEDVLDVVDPRAAEPLTVAGVVMGTPAYMAPEQHRGETAGPAADQYAFCVALWEALVGTRPFEADDLDALVRCKAEGPPPWPKTIDVPLRITQALRRGLATDPADRFATMDELVVALADDPARTARRRAFAATGVIAAASASLAIAGWQRSHTALCTGAEDQLAPVWNAERRAAAESAMRATKQTYAADTWAAIAPALDEWSAQWIRSHTDSCEATAVRGEQSAAVLDLRMACLQRARGQLRSVTDMLVHADEAVVLHAHTMVASLPALDRCADIVALQSDVPPPDDAAIAIEVDDIRDRLADASALSRIGKAQDALDRIDELVARADATDHPPIRTELGISRGQALMALGRFAEAESELRDTLRSALQIGQLRQAAWAASGLTLVVGDRLSRAPEGLAFADVAIGLAQSDIGDPHAQASARNNLANVLSASGRYAEAEAEHRRVLAMRIELRGEHHYDVASSRLNLGNVLVNQGRLAEAESEIAAALAILREHLGDDHPEVAVAHSGLGGIALTAGHFAEAEASFREALRNPSRDPEPRTRAGGGSARKPRQRTAVAGTARRGRAGAARDSDGHRVGARHEAPERRDRPQQPRIAAAVGRPRRRGRGRVSQCIHHCRRGARRHASDHVDVPPQPRGHALRCGTPRRGRVGAPCRVDAAARGARCRSSGHRAHVGASRHDPAAGRSSDGGRGRVSRGRGGMGARDRPDHVEMGEALVGLGQSLARQHRDADALPELQEAYRLNMRREQKAPAEQRAEAAFSLAQVLWSTPSERDRALQLAREARDTYATVSGTRADAPRAEVAQWLAAPTRHERGAPPRRL